MSSHHLLIPGVILSDFGIKIAHEDVDVSLWVLGHDVLQSVVKAIFCLVVTVVGWSIALDNIHLDLLPFWF